MNNLFKENIYTQIQEGGDISPFLFLSDHLEMLHHKLLTEIHDICRHFGVDTHSIFSLSDTGESIKIEDIRQFILPSYTRPRQKFQVFFIENISRMTPQSQNACLKFFEEAGEGNIIILTASSLVGILDTVQSRLQIQQVGNKQSQTLSPFYISLIEDFISGKNDSLIRYFFSEKLEKQEYITFLQTLLGFLIQSQYSLSFLDELYDDIGGILRNNLSPRGVVDKYILKLAALKSQ